MSEYADEALSDYLSRTDQDDVPLDEARQALHEQIEVVEDKMMEDLDDRQKIDYAIGMLSADDIAEARLSGDDGDPMDLQILSIGHRGVWEDAPMTPDGVDVVISHAVIRGPLGADGEQKAAKAVLFNRSDHTDLLNVQSKFHALNEMTATYSVEEAWNLDGFYRCTSMEETTLTETSLDDLPSSRDDKNEMLRQIFDDVELADLAEAGAGMSAYDPESGFTHDWGADIKRFTATIADYYIADDNSWGVYTLMDDSVTPDDIEDVETVLPSGEEVHLTGENQSIPGLDAWCEPDYHMNYGRQSVVDVYGVIETGRDGQLQMTVAGIVPIIPMEMEDGEVADEDVQATETGI